MNKKASIIIPLYNKAQTIARAITSAQAQTWANLEIIIIDDGSTDDSLSIAEQHANDNTQVFSTENQGVALARNYGILQSSGEFIACLDADDHIDPAFIETCITPMLENNGIGITYTRLMTHLPDGETKLSQWPAEFDPGRQFSHKQRMNQIPTCCLFRREGFDRVGGYRQRYAPQGAGSEDAAFWTAILATGYTAQLVTNEALFHYTAFSGNVSGNRDYVEPDWLAFYPWTRTNNHPFASPLEPKRIAHIVRDYSEPIVSIIVPVGDTHSQYLQDCIDSIEAQEFWQWELIIVDDTTEQAIKDLWFMAAYPFAKILRTGGKQGAGYARNRGAEIAKGNFLLFLDSDDMLNPAYPQAIGDMVLEYQRSGNAIYTAYVGRSFIEDITELAPNLQKNIIARDEDGETWIYHPVYPYHCKEAIKQPSQDGAGNVYIWCNVSTLIPRAWHQEINGFDEAMQTWEDIDYWWRVAKAGHCFSQIDEAFLIYRFYSSTRREWAHEEDDEGRKNFVNLLDYLKEKHSGVETMGCNCGSKKTNIQKMPASVMATAEKEAMMTDGDYVMIEFTPNWRGNRRLKSPTGKRTPNGKQIDYNEGYDKRPGDTFLVHIEDQKAKPEIFKLPVKELPEIKAEVVEPEPIAETTPAPKPITKELPSFELDHISLTSKQRRELGKAGITTIDEVKALGFDGLVRLPGFGKVSANKLLGSLE